MRILGIDYGDARTGIAISDLLCSIVGSTTVIHSKGREKTIEEIRSNVAAFIEYAKQHPELRFHVRKVGYDKAGYTVEQIAPVKLLVGVSESDYTKVHKGDAVVITADALPGEEFVGTINRIYPTVDPSTRTFTVEVKVANADKKLRPGMFARATVTFGLNNSIIIPDVAVVKQQGSGERFVYVLNSDGTVSYTKVVLGRRLGAEYEVLEGLSDGAKVVTGGQIRLKDGVNVVVNE